MLSGAQKQRDRWKRAVDATNDALGFAVGQLYVERYFPPAEKARAQAMVANLIAAFRERIDRLDWMAPATKAEAKAKLAVLKVGVGYPDTWPDYAGARGRDAATPTATPSAPSCSSYQQQPGQAGPAGGPRASG